MRKTLAAIGLAFGIVTAVPIATPVVATSASAQTHHYRSGPYGLTVGPPQTTYQPQRRRPHAYPRPRGPHSGYHRPRRPHSGYYQPRPHYGYQQPRRPHSGYHRPQPRPHYGHRGHDQRGAIVRRSMVVIGGAMVGAGAVRGAHAAPASRLPSPQEIYSRVPHKTSYVCAPCVPGYAQDEESCECTRARWVPGPPPR